MNTYKSATCRLSLVSQLILIYIDNGQRIPSWKKAGREQDRARREHLLVNAQVNGTCVTFTKTSCDEEGHICTTWLRICHMGYNFLST